MLAVHLKRLIGSVCVLVMLFVISGMIIPDIAQSSCPDGIQAYWKLDESSGNTFEDFVDSTQAVCTGTCPQSVADGKILGAQRFSTSTEVTAVGDTFNWAQNTSFSIEFWIKKDVACADTEEGATEVLVGRNSPTTPLHWWVGIDCLGGGVAQFTVRDTAGGLFYVTGTTVVTDGNWHHIAAIQDNANHKLILYVDGKLDAQTAATFTTGFDATDAPLDIGWLNAFYKYYYLGILDELAIYNRVLTANEILGHYYLTRSYCSDCSIPVKIMPLGDSLTQGSPSDQHPADQNDSTYWISYRKALLASLTGAGYIVDYVGTQQSGEAVAGFTDYDYEGHGGFDADAIAAGITDWLTAANPDVVLLHIGSVDTELGASGVGTILDNINAYNENITVVLAKIINRSTTDTQENRDATATFNTQLEALADARIALGYKIILVDMYAGAGLNYDLYPTGDMWDIKHPVSTGYTKMATVWFNALGTFLPACTPTAPHITSTAVTKVFVNQPYHYTVTAIGNPVPTYSLDTPPDGMTINSTTGEISWTPLLTGTYPVSVVATNTQGHDTQNFDVVVNPDPHCDAGMLSYWKLNEAQGNTYEDFFSAHDGTCAGECPSAVTGEVGGAQEFNGSSTGVNVVANSDFDWAADGSFTIEYWMKKSTACTNNQVVLGRDAPEEGNSMQWWAGCFEDGTASFVLISQNGDGSGETDYLQSSAPVTDDHWHHIAAVRDGVAGQNLLYVDGVLQDSAYVSYAAGFASPSAALNMGWLSLGTGHRFEGDVDELAVYNQALTLAEIQKHYGAGLLGLDYCQETLAPSIIQQPSSVTKGVGQTATFSIVAVGTAPLAYQWQKGTVDISGANSASYTTPTIVIGDNGTTYRCVVTNGHGSPATSTSATLTVVALPTITAQPSPQTVNVGETATFSVTASGASLTYQWQKDSVDISGATSATYTTPTTVAGDNGKTFRCVVTNLAGSVNSDGALLTVDIPATAPSITTQPSNQTVNLGETATFSVVASGTAPLSYQWQKNSGAGFNDISGATLASYTTPATVEGDNGATFRCVVTNSVDHATSNGATLTVDIPPTAPSITTQPTPQKVKRGQTATFTVVASGSAPLSYQWQKNGVDIPGATSATYTTPATVASDNGATFLCIVTNSVDHATSNSVKLTVASPFIGWQSVLYLLTDD